MMAPQHCARTRDPMTVRRRSESVPPNADSDHTSSATAVTVASPTVTATTTTPPQQASTASHKTLSSKNPTLPPSICLRAFTTYLKHIPKPAPALSFPAPSAGGTPTVLAHHSSRRSQQFPISDLPATLPSPVRPSIAPNQRPGFPTSVKSLPAVQPRSHFRDSRGADHRNHTGQASHLSRELHQPFRCPTPQFPRSKSAVPSTIRQHNLLSCESVHTGQAPTLTTI
ncbi:hypothetical protein QBC39DRAFT_178962 [Podospora conica]|nr:hypothetical protein QBC39DRAFT_178962 [Schizothecium conicum]